MCFPTCKQTTLDFRAKQQIFQEKQKSASKASKGRSSTASTASAVSAALVSPGGGLRPVPIWFSRSSNKVLLDFNCAARMDSVTTWLFLCMSLATWCLLATSSWVPTPDLLVFHIIILYIHSYIIYMYIYHICRLCRTLLHVPHFVSAAKLDHTPGQAKGPKGQRANASRVSRVSNCDGRGAVVGFAPRGLHWKMCQRPLAALLLYSLQGMGFFWRSFDVIW